MKASRQRVIAISGLEVYAFIGVPEEERSIPQRLLLDLRFTASLQPDSLEDELSKTVDYHAVTLRVAEIAGERRRKLIETLAEELAAAILEEFGLCWIEVTVKKFIVPATEHVSVSVRREVS